MKFHSLLEKHSMLLRSISLDDQHRARENAGIGFFRLLVVT